VLDSSVLELCGTSDSLSKRHQLVTLRGCHLLDGLVDLTIREKDNGD
jgi:hypothetical protein